MNAIKQFLLRRVWGRIEGKLVEWWPEAWPRVRKALVGWKTLAGVVVIYTPEILAKVDDLLRQAGFDPSAIVVALGSILAAAGAVHKLLKLLLPEEPEAFPGPGVQPPLVPRGPEYSRPESFAGDDVHVAGWIVTRTDHSGAEPRITKHWGRSPEDARRAAEEA